MWHYLLGKPGSNNDLIWSLSAGPGRDRKLPETDGLMIAILLPEPISSKFSRELREAAPALGLSVCKGTVRDLQAFRNATQQGTVVSRMGIGAKPAARDIACLFSEMIEPKIQKVANE